MRDAAPEFSSRRVPEASRQSRHFRP